MTLDDLARESFGKPERLVPTGAIRPGEWLLIHTTEFGQTLYVADEDAVTAKALFPDLPVHEVNNATHTLGPERRVH